MFSIFTRVLVMLCFVGSAANWFPGTTYSITKLSSQEATKAASISGNWEGVLSIGERRLRLVLKVSESPEGLKAVMDSLDQPGSNDLRVDSITFQKNVLHFEMKALQIVYEGAMNQSASEIVGTFTQGGSLPLVFRKQGIAQSTASVQRGRIQMKPCNKPDLSSEVLCGKYEVFENRATRIGRKIALNIVLLPATNPKPAPDPLFYLAGGPGGAATNYATQSFMTGLRRNRDVVLVDQRGTGESNLLNCPARASRDDMRGHFADPLPVEWVKACRAELEKTADLTLYTTSIAMDDLDEVRAALGYNRINVYGGSYGSTAALVYLRQYPARVRAVAIFGVAPPAAKIPLSFSRGVQDAMNRLYADCAADRICNATYPHVKDEFTKVLAQFDKGPVEVEAPNVFTGRTQKVLVSRDAFVDAIRQLLYVPTAAAAVPGLIHLGVKGNLGPLIGTAFQVVEQISSRLARGMQLSVICSEDTPFITDEEIRTTSANSFYGDARVRPTIKACAEWPRAKVAASFLDPVKSDKPVLLVSGALDPVTPPWLAQIVAQSLPNGRLIIAQNVTHNSYECIESLIADFIDKGSPAGVDVSCVEKIQRPPFLIIPGNN